MKPTLGPGITIDVPRIVETRTLVQSNSGGGKSRTIRRLLEQVYGHVQLIVLDREGEYSTLRELFDFIICAPHGADAVARPQTASLLARRILELNVSAIVDVSDLKSHEQQRFMKLFIESMMNAPKTLWRPVLVVIDEAHFYCPEKGQAESTGAVIDLCTRGRKRGFSAVLATQRLAKLNKDAAAELLNVMIGRTGLDVDVKRAADILGMSAKEAMATLRHLKPGEFYVFGPALSMTVEKVHVGPVKTTHPEAGKRIASVQPAPSGKIKKVLGELDDLQEEAEVEAKTIADLKKDNANLRRELTNAQKNIQVKEVGVPNAEAVRRELKARELGRKEVLDKLKINNAQLVTAVKAMEKVKNIIEPVLKDKDYAATELPDLPSLKQPPVSRSTKFSPPPKHQASTPISSDVSLRAGAVRILQELSSRFPAGYTKPQVGALTGFKHTGGTFNTYMSNLRNGGFIQTQGKLIYATEAGIEYLGDSVPATPSTHDEVMELWKKALRIGAYRILELIVEAGKNGIEKEEIASQLDMTASGGTFNTYLSNLRSNGLVVNQGGVYVATDILFPEAG